MASRLAHLPLDYETPDKFMAKPFLPFNVQQQRAKITLKTRLNGCMRA
jgi:hypothetical protein